MSKKGKKQVFNNTEVLTERSATAQAVEETATVETAQVETAAEVSTESTSDVAQVIDDVVAEHAGGTPPATETETEEQPLEAEPQTSSPIEEAHGVESRAEAEVSETQALAEVVAAAKGVPLSDAMKKIHELEAKILALSASKGTRRVASGSKARPNVKYTLLSRPPKWDGAPQVAQLMQILYDPKFVEAHKLPDGSVEIPEPELFAQIERGAAAGVLRTKQLPVRIFQYYRNDLLQANCLLWK